MKRLRIGLCYDLAAKHKPKPGEPRDKAAELDSPETVQALQETMTALGHEVLPIGDGQDLLKFLTNGGKVDLVFNIAEGLRGRSREAQVPALLEMLDVPYTGADPLTLAICLDKAMFKRVLIAEGIPTPAFREIHSAAEAKTLNFPLPAFVKPSTEGSGKGIKADCRVATLEALRDVTLRIGTTYGWPVIVEEYLPGMELTVGVVGNGDARVVGSMQVEFLPGSGGVYSYQTKKNCFKLVDYIVPPRLPGDVLEEVEAVALKTYHAVGCRDFGRVDLRLDKNGHPSVLEINPLAGLNPITSDIVIMTKAQGVLYQTLIGDILKSAIGRMG